MSIKTQGPRAITAMEAVVGKKILIVDDSRTIRQQVNFTLQKSGFVVVEADNGEKGIEVLAANPDVALVLSDVNMPNMGGLDMLEKIRANPNYANLPVVILTTEGAADMLERAKSLGAKGWVVKPFKPDQLIAVVNKLTA
jgi:two-component system chemotaxis response regulator CheY